MKASLKWNDYYIILASFQLFNLKQEVLSTFQAKTRPEVCFKALEQEPEAMEDRSFAGVSGTPKVSQQTV